MMNVCRRAALELRGGTGIEFPMGEMLTGVIEVGYEYGLTSFIKEKFEANGQASTARNLSFTMGVRF